MTDRHGMRAFLDKEIKMRVELIERIKEAVKDKLGEDIEQEKDDMEQEENELCYLEELQTLYDKECAYEDSLLKEF